MQDRDQNEGNDTGLHHDVQALGTQGRADGGVALSGQGKRQRAGVDLVRQRGGAVLIEVALDDGLTPVMASLTVAVEMLLSSSQMEIVPLLAASSVGGRGKGRCARRVELQLDDQPSVSL